MSLHCAIKHVSLNRGHITCNILGKGSASLRTLHYLIPKDEPPPYGGVTVLGGCVNSLQLALDICSISWPLGQTIDTIINGIGNAPFHCRTEAR